MSGSDRSYGQHRPSEAMMAALLLAGGPATAALEVRSPVLHSVGVQATSYPVEHGLLSLSDRDGLPLSVSVLGHGLVGVIPEFPGTTYAWLQPGDTIRVTTVRGASIVGVRGAHALQLGLVCHDRSSHQLADTLIEPAMLRRLAGLCGEGPVRIMVEQAVASEDAWDTLRALADVLVCGVPAAVDECVRHLRDLSPAARASVDLTLLEYESLLSTDDANRQHSTEQETRTWPTLAVLAERDRDRMGRLRDVLNPETSEERT
ncbi:MAG: hypothetical protein IPF98_22570 [Gemmatimonadetes bacterium]|nr:hypothetical protein [Gemmatimonadota bacterium]